MIKGKPNTVIDLTPVLAIGCYFVFGYKVAVFMLLTFIHIELISIRHEIKTRRE